MFFNESSEDIIWVNRIEVVEEIYRRLGYISSRSQEDGVSLVVMTTDEPGFSVKIAERTREWPGFNIGGRLLVKTNDCLKSLHMLGKEKIEVFSMPYYSDEGLVANFYDCAGNLYVLVEEREYAMSGLGYYEDI